MRRGLVAALVVVAALAAEVRCPLDRSRAVPTGRLTVQSGRYLAEYECAYGDRFWVVVPR